MLKKISNKGTLSTKTHKFYRFIKKGPKPLIFTLTTTINNHGDGFLCVLQVSIKYSIAYLDIQRGVPLGIQQGVPQVHLGIQRGVPLGVPVAVVHQAVVEHQDSLVVVHQDSLVVVHQDSLAVVPRIALMWCTRIAL